MGEHLRRRVSYGQLEHLWVFLDKRRDIAVGYNNTSQARSFSRRMWEEIALNLNALGDGAVKDWKGWCKYWNDYKSKLKKLAAATKASQQKTGGGQSIIKPMTDIERKLLHILGNDFGSGLPGIRVEPFEEVLNQVEINPITPCETHSVPVSSGHSESILATYDVQPRPSWNIPTFPAMIQVTPSSPNPQSQRSPRRSLRHNTPTPPPQPSAILPQCTGTPTTTPRRSPRRRVLAPPSSPHAHLASTTERRRRRSRREPPMTIENARRALIVELQKQTKIQEEKLNLFRTHRGNMRNKKILLNLGQIMILPETVNNAVSNSYTLLSLIVCIGASRARTQSHCMLAFELPEAYLHCSIEAQEY